MTFADREQAGQLLAKKLTAYPQSIVVGLARGGVVVAHAIAKQLSLPLDVLVVKKIPSPAQPELALGAMAPDHVSIIDYRRMQLIGVDETYLKIQMQEISSLIDKRESLYRKRKKPLTVREKTIYVVDDGVATGATIEAAIQWFRKKKARKIIACIPVMSHDLVGKISPEVDELVTLETPKDFQAVNQFYKEFPQIEDEEVKRLLDD